jgi:hypothetical protein
MCELTCRYYKPLLCGGVHKIQNSRRSFKEQLDALSAFNKKIEKWLRATGGYEFEPK